MKSLTLMFLFLSFLFISCNSYNSNFIYQSPENINDGIAVSSLMSVNIDTTLIARAVNKINSGKFGEVHSILIYKDNLLVLEEYFPGHRYKWDAPKYHGEFVSQPKEPTYLVARTHSADGFGVLRNVYRSQRGIWISHATPHHCTELHCTALHHSKNAVRNSFSASGP